ncbi:MAG: CotH kinase family protein [Opitutaceae bacterium]
MKNPPLASTRLFLFSALCTSAVLLAQPPATPTANPGGAPAGQPPPGAQPGRGPGGGPAPAGELKLVGQFDKNGDKVLNAAERAAAREFLRANPPPRRGGGRGRGPQTPPEPGVHLTPAEVKTYGSEGLYDPKTLRTLFLQFEESDWEKEMEDFNRTDVDVPATVIVDGKTYRDVGVHFRGASSYFQIPTGLKRSLNVSFDHAHEKQTLMGFRTLNLLNSHEDASFLRPVLYSRIAQDYLAAPRMNFVRVVINGENWGIYSSAEQFSKEFAQERFGTASGARWKVPGSPNGRGSLAYLGEDPAPYKAIYDIKSKDDKKSWAKLIHLCKVLNETAPEQLEAALAPLLDVDSALKFLALEMTLVNGDGYWTRTSDYSIAEDSKGRLHIVPHDMNETFSVSVPFGPARGGGRGGPGPGGPGPGGPGPGGPPPQGGAAPGAAPTNVAGTNPPPGPPGGPGPGGPGGPGPGGPGRGRGISGTQLDPLIGATNVNSPLAAKLLAVPELRTRYLSYVRDIAEKWLDWSRLGPIAQEFHVMIDADVKRDTRKLESYEDFVTSVEGSPKSLKTFAEQRREFLLSFPAIKDLPRSPATATKR